MMNETIKREKSFANSFTYLLIGGGIGAGLALLFAPKSGSELRTDIGVVTRKGYEATIDRASDLKGKSSELVGVAKEKAAALYDLASNKLNTGAVVAGEVVNQAATATAEAAGRIQDEATNQDKPFSGRVGTAIV